MIYLRRQPFAMAGLILALGSLGNLVQSYGAGLHLALGALALLLWLTYTLNLVLNYSAFKEEMTLPLPASVFPSYAMAGMVLSTYLKPLLGLPLAFAEGLWYLALTLNLYLLIRYSLRYLPQFKIETVFPSWGVVFVGFAVGSVTAPVYGNYGLGQSLFYLALIGAFAVMPFMLYRVYALRDLDPSAQQTIAILCAPFSLLLAAYINSFDQVSPFLLALLLCLSQLLYFSVLFQLPRLLRLGFFPTSAALTFPLVISALSLKLVLPVLALDTSLSRCLVSVETVLACSLVAYVSCGYLFRIFHPRLKVGL